MSFDTGSLGREHPEISEDAAEEEENAETDTEDGVPVFREITFHNCFPFCCGDEGADGAASRKRHAVRAEINSAERLRSRPHRQIGTREKLEKARLAGGFDAERTVRGGFAQMRRLEAGGIRLEFPQGTEAGTAVASAGLKSGASAGPHDREMPGAFRLRPSKTGRGGRFYLSFAG